MTDIDAPTLMGVMVPLLLYADDLILMSESAAGLQKQSNALASFCEECQLTVNLSKTKVAVFEHRQSDATLCLMVQLWKGWRATSTWALLYTPPKQ